MLLVVLLLISSASPAQRVSGQFPYPVGFAYHDAASKYSGLYEFFDGNTNFTGWVATVFGTNWVLDDSSNFVFTFPRPANFKLKKIEIYDGSGAYGADSATKGVQFYYVPHGTYARTLLGNWGAGGAYAWRAFTLADSTSIDAIHMVVHRGHSNVILPTEIKIYGSWDTWSEPAMTYERTPFNQHLGENFYHWTLQSSSNVHAGTNAVRTGVFTDVMTNGRFYCDWRLLQPYDPTTVPGGKAYMPQSTPIGGWRTDDCLKALRDSGIAVVLDVKGVPDYIGNSFPGPYRNDRVPVKWTGDTATWLAAIKLPESYRAVAMMHTQLAIRYGRNTAYAPSHSLVNTDSTGNKYSTATGKNIIKIGTDLVDVLEIGNEHNGRWAGRFSYLAPRECAAMMSAVYDGHKGTMGDTVGVKNIDPTMKVALFGMVGNNPGYIVAMIDWCREFRGYKPDGAVNICWDIIKFHNYISDAGTEQTENRTRGAAPETVDYQKIVDRMVRAGMGYMWEDYSGAQLPVMIGEQGYDMNNTPQKAVATPGKGREHAMADWLLRSSLVNMTTGIASTQFYQFADDASAKFNADGSIDTTTAWKQYYSSGIVTRADVPVKRFPAYVFQQVKKNFAAWEFDSFMQWPHLGHTLASDPAYNGDSAFVIRIKRGDSLGYIAWYGTEIGQTGTIHIPIGMATSLRRYDLAYTDTNTLCTTVTPIDGVLTAAISEHPVFFKVLAGGDSVHTIQQSAGYPAPVCFVSPDNDLDCSRR